MNAHRARIDPTTIAVAPGNEATCTVRITNTGDVVDAFYVEVLGAPSAWTAVEPPAVSLFPGAEGTARLTFRPPRSPEVPAGPMPFAVRVQSQDARLDTSVVEEGTLDVGRFTELAADLLPRTSHGIFAGRHRVHLTNRGNAPTTARLSGSDVEQALDLLFAPATIPVRPGSTAGARVKARCRNLSLTGAPHQWSFKVVAEADDTPPVELQGAMEQRPLLGRWTRRALAVGAIALVGMAVYSVKGQDMRSAVSVVLNGNRTGQAAPSSPGGPGPGQPSPSNSVPSPSPSPSSVSTNTPRPSPTSTPTLARTPTPSPITLFSASSAPTQECRPGCVNFQPWELGLRFYSDVDGYVTAIRFYKGSQNTGAHQGNLWSSDGQQHWTAAFTSESSSGWQQANFSSPVRISAKQTYVVSFNTSGDFFYSDNFDAAGANNPPLHGIAAVFTSSPGAFPNLTITRNYWVDIVFTSSSIRPTP